MSSDQEPESNGSPDMAAVGSRQPEPATPAKPTEPETTTIPETLDQSWVLSEEARRGNHKPSPEGLAVEPTRRSEAPDQPELKNAPADLVSISKAIGAAPPPPGSTTTWRQAKALQKRQREERIRRTEELTGDKLPGWLSWPLDLVLMVLISWVAYVGVTGTYRGYGHSWDEALYLQPGRSAVQWWSQWMRGDRSMTRPEAIKEYWGEQMEDRLHPEIAPVPKLLIGLGDSRVLERLLPSPDDSPVTATRLPVACLFALTVAMVYIIAARDGGRLVGLMAAMALGMGPRVFGHAHIAASETALLFATTLLLLVWQVGMRLWIIGLLLAGPVLGLALATKVTAAILPIPLMVWALIYRRQHFGPAAFSLMFLAPLTMFAIWPWFWHDTVMRLAEYATFYSQHQSTALWYLGRPWGYTHGPPAPWHYPLAILGAGLPEWILLFALGGIARTLWGWRQRHYPVLWLLVGLAWIVIASLPAAPKYDGDRLFLPVMVPIALMAGHGFGGLLALVFERRLFQSVGTAIARIVTGLAILGLCGGWAWWDLRQWQGAHLNYFNKVVGGAAGAQRLGFETTYWGEAVNEEVLSWLSTKTAETSGARVRVLALNPLAFENMQDWGLVPRDIDFTPEGPPPYDWYVIQHREGFHGRLERAIWSSEPTAEFVSGGLPRVRIVDGQKFYSEREEQAPASSAGIPLTAALPTPTSQPTPVTATPADIATSGSNLQHGSQLSTQDTDAPTTTTSMEVPTPK